MTALEEYLEAAGFQPRKAQTDLFTHLISTDHRGVVAQAGTGTGKSAAVISAAAHQARNAYQEQSIIVTPTLTLMNQYRDGDIPIAEKAFPDLRFAELRGRAHYWCEMTKSGYDLMQVEYYGGCDGSEAGCSLRGWAGHEDCESGCDDEHEIRWLCEYQASKKAAMAADVVVTNADMLIVNDKILAPLGAEIFSLGGSLFVDEAHTLEQKLRDYASRSLFWKSVERFKFCRDEKAPIRQANRIKSQDRNLALKDTRGFPSADLIAIANAVMPPARPKDGLTKQRETQEACARIVAYMDDPHDSAVLHVNSGSLKMDWINVAKSSGELLTARQFGLVSATVPRSMSAALGVPEAPFIDVGHPFDYGTQAWIGFSPYGGDYRSAQSETNLTYRVQEVRDLIHRAKGGALVLFSSFKDLEIVSEELRPELLQAGYRVLIQERDMEAKDRQALADEFKADGNAILFGSESFATGFDVPGDALRLVVLWKLPYPAVDPVSNAIRAQSYQRYEDIMKVRAVQAIGRLIRRESDKGIVWLADSRGRRLLDHSDPLTSHIPQFARL
jgi:Rad3-related DNA helicase